VLLTYTRELQKSGCPQKFTIYKFLLVNQFRLCLYNKVAKVFYKANVNITGQNTYTAKLETDFSAGIFPDNANNLAHCKSPSRNRKSFSMIRPKMGLFNEHFSEMKEHCGPTDQRYEQLYSQNNQNRY